MPVIEDSTPLLYPERSSTIVKYVDLTKFISILQRRALFFCRVDKLEDKFEGRTAKPNFKNRVAYQMHLRDSGFFTTKFSDEQIIQGVKDYYEFEEKFRAITCINSWNKEATESAALWKIYSSFNYGIMIRSSVERLQESLIKTSEVVRLSEITYLDYENELMRDGNTSYPFIHKQKAYSYEQEIRLIHQVSDEGFVHDWSKEEVEEGIYISLDLDKLVQDVTVAPNAPNWFLDLVENIVKKYDLNKAIKKSLLSSPSRF